MLSRLILIIAILFLAGCKNAGRDLLTSADRSLKEGNYAAALLNINQFFKQYPSSPDTGKAKQIRNDAGVGKREETTEEIQAMIAQQEIAAARKLAAKIPQEYIYLPDNDHFFAAVDSQIKRVEFEILAIELERALEEAKVESLMLKLESMHERFAADTDFVPQLGNLDSVINAAMQQIPQPPSHVRNPGHPPQVPLPPKAK